MIRKTFYMILVSCMMIITFTACSSNTSFLESADIVVYGTIWTAEDNDTVEVFAVKDGKYIYVGDDEKGQKNDMLELLSEETYNSGYPMKSLIDNDVIMSSSTDAPADVFVEGNIMNVLEAATTGKQPNDVPFKKG